MPSAQITAFVTGGTGLVGSHLLLDLLRNGVRVKALCRRHSQVDRVRRVFRYYSDAADTLFGRIDWIEGDLLHPAEWKGALQDVQQVYHSAALVSFLPGDKDLLFQTNVTGTEVLLEQCQQAGIQKFCFISSVAVLGKSTGDEGGFIDEAALFTYFPGISDYACSKFEAEQAVWKAINNGLKAVVVNPGVILGPGDWERSSASFIHHVWKGMPFYSHGGTGFVDVRDVSGAAIALTNSAVSGQRFLLCAANLSYWEFLSSIADALGKRRPFIPAQPWMSNWVCRLDAWASAFTGKPPRYTPAILAAAHQRHRFSNERIKKTIGYAFIPIEQTLRDVCGFYLQDLRQNDAAGV